MKPGSFRPRTPFHMVWLSTDACNARCLHCSSNSFCRSPDELTTAEVFRLFEELAEAGVVDLAVSGGEPLLRKDLFEILRHAAALGLSMGVGSNGTTLTESSAARFAELGIGRYQVSLDGLEASHDTLRCWPGLFRRVLKTVEMASRAGLRTHVCCTINRLNFQELEGFAELVAGLPVQRINFSRYVPTGRGTDDLDLTEAEWHRVIRLCVELKERYRGRLGIVSHLAQQILVDPEVEGMPGFIGCQAGIGQGCVTANGTVQPCVLLPVPVGNVRERPFGEIWRTSPVIRALQAREHLGGACGSCVFKSRCGGCRAVALARTGDYLAADERCWLTQTSAPAA
ncbi:MAG: radical SAM protein [Thermoanaerobaculia bacterium]